MEPGMDLTDLRLSLSRVNNRRQHLRPSLRRQPSGGGRKQDLQVTPKGACIRILGPRSELRASIEQQRRAGGPMAIDRRFGNSGTLYDGVYAHPSQSMFDQ